MRFVADHHFVIGSHHVNQGKPCQDHALSFVRSPAAFGVVSDGCGSGGETDLGARIINFSTRALLWVPRDLPEGEDALSGFIPLIKKEQPKLLAQLKTLLALEETDLLATSIIACLGPSRGWVHCVGDGVVAAKFADGSLLFSRLEWGNNMPFYPAYAEQKENFVVAHGGKDRSVLSDECWLFTEENGYVRAGETRYTLASAMEGVTFHYHDDDYQKLVALAVFTDGVTQVDGVDWKDVVRSLLNFKTIEGQFAKRRMNRFVKDMQKTGKGPLDDLAYAVIVRAPTDEGEADDDIEANTEVRA